MGYTLNNDPKFRDQFTFAGYNLTVGATAEIALEYSCGSLAANGFTDSIPGYEVVDIFAEWAPQASVGEFKLRAEVNHLFDETYYSRGTFANYSVAGGLIQVDPVNSPGRSFMLTATAKF